MLKNFKKFTLYIICVLIIYIVVCFILLNRFSHGNTEIGLYNMNVAWSETSQVLEEAVNYRQRFYTPCNCSGIQLAMATDFTNAQKDLVVCIYDSSTEKLMGEHVVSYKEIKDNEYVNILFGNYILMEGKQYYFEIHTKRTGENPLRLWMGKVNSEFDLDVIYQGETLPDISIAFNLIYDYTNKNFVIWMFWSVLCLLSILRLTEVEIQCQKKI